MPIEAKHTSIKHAGLPLSHSAILTVLKSKLATFELFDLGAGGHTNSIKKQLQKKYLGMLGYYPYDPFHLSEVHNAFALNAFRNNTSLRALKIVTISNVLNVIPDKTERKEVLSLAFSLAPDVILITTYEGDKSGVPTKKRHGATQLNRRTQSYLNEIKEETQSTSTEYTITLRNGVITMRRQDGK